MISAKLDDSSDPFAFPQEEASAAQAAAARDQVWEKARQSDQTGGMNLSQTQPPPAPHCAAPPGPGKFCGECGKELHPKTQCPACNAKLTPNSKFCGALGFG